MEGEIEVSRNDSDNPVRRNKPRRNRSRSSSAARGARVRVAAALGILVIWGGTTIVDMLSSTYNNPDGVNTVALAAATYLFGSAFMKENKQ
jgi:hypothetical protein